MRRWASAAHVAARCAGSLEGVLAPWAAAVGRGASRACRSRVGLALVPEALGGLLVEVEALGRRGPKSPRTLVPVKGPASAWRARMHLGVLVGGAGGVVDAQDERAAVGAGKGPVVDGGAGAADVQLAGGGRRKANAHGLVCHGVSSSLGSYLHTVHQYSAVRSAWGKPAEGRPAAHAGALLATNLAFWHAQCAGTRYASRKWRLGREFVPNPNIPGENPPAAPPTCQTPETVAPAATLPVTPRPSPMSRVVPRAMKCGRWHEIGGNELRNAAVGLFPANGPFRAQPLTTSKRPSPMPGPPAASRACDIASGERPRFSPGKLFAKRSLRGEGGLRAAVIVARVPRRRPYITFVDSSLRSIHSVSLSAGLLSPRPTTSETTT